MEHGWVETAVQTVKCEEEASGPADRKRWRETEMGMEKGYRKIQGFETGLAISPSFFLWIELYYLFIYI